MHGACGGAVRHVQRKIRTIRRSRRTYMCGLVTALLGIRHSEPTVSGAPEKRVTGDFRDHPHNITFSK
eukprot:scaffold43683_cov20-Tisochrysis_lutea.AAC.3